MNGSASDPFAMFRDAVTQWEKMANDWGGQLLNRPESAQAMHNATSVALKAQQGAHEAMAKLLAAANMPSKADVEALGARIANVEAMLARIEARLSSAEQAPPAPQPKPKRTRQPAS